MLGSIKEWFSRLFRRNRADDSSEVPLEEKLDRLNDRLEENRAGISGVEQNVGSIQANLDQLEKELKRGNKELFRIRTLWEQRYKLLDEALGQINEDLKQSSGLIIRELRSRESEAAGTQLQVEWCLDLIDLLDGLAQCLHAIKQVVAAGSSSASGWYEGLARLYRRGESILAKHGIKPIPAVGEIFDPALHRVVEVRKRRSGRDGEIVEEYRRGYRTKDRVLRFSEVAVVKVMEKPDLDKYRRVRRVRCQGEQNYRNRSRDDQFSCRRSYRQTAPGTGRRRRPDRTFGGRH